MSSINYFSPSINYPPIIEATVGGIIDYFAKITYEDEYKVKASTAISRFVLSQVDAGSDIAIGDSIKIFKQNQGKFPFTAYGFGDSTLPTERRNTHLKSGTVYSNELGMYIEVWPETLLIPLFSFFTRGDDFYRAKTAMSAVSAGNPKIKVPVTLQNSQGVSLAKELPVRLTFEPNKGNYAGAFEEFLQKGEIWDIDHSVEVEFMNMRGSGLTVHPVHKVIINTGRIDPNGNFYNLTLADEQVYP